MALTLYVAPEAKTDLKDIYRFGLRQWGKVQSEKYLAQLEDVFWSLTEQPCMGAERHELQNDIRAIVVASHTIFYRVTDIQLQIVRVLHNRQDPNSRRLPAGGKPWMA